MQNLHVQEINRSNFLFDYYLKNSLTWDKNKKFAPNGLSKSDFDDTMVAYALYGEDVFVGLSIVKFDKTGNVVDYWSIVDDFADEDRRSEYLNQEVSQKVKKLEMMR